VTFAFRQLKGAPGFTVVAAVTLALGIGANSAMFALADATLFRPLPFAEPERLMMVWERTPTCRCRLWTGKFNGATPGALSGRGDPRH
jgi:hypothetical protein